MEPRSAGAVNQSSSAENTLFLPNFFSLSVSCSACSLVVSVWRTSCTNDMLARYDRPCGHAHTPFFYFYFLFLVYIPFSLFPHLSPSFGQVELSAQQLYLCIQLIRRARYDRPSQICQVSSGPCLSSARVPLASLVTLLFLTFPLLRRAGGSGFFSFHRSVSPSPCSSVGPAPESWHSPSTITVFRTCHVTLRPFLPLFSLCVPLSLRFFFGSVAPL